MEIHAAKVAAVGGLSRAWCSCTTDEAESIARHRFGVLGKAIRFETEKDDTFRIKRTDGTSFILKVANPGESEEEVSFQIGILEHVKDANPKIPVPRVIPTISGLLHEWLEDRSGARRQVWLLRYMEGLPLESTGSTAVERFEVGRALAELRFATTRFRHPGQYRKLAWDVQHALELRHLLSHITDKPRRDALERGLNRYAEVQPRLAHCRFQVLHNDFSKSNILVDRADPRFVTGIIDFGDSVHTAVAIDVSTAMLNQLPRNKIENDILADGRDLLRGYLSVADLTHAELALIPHLIMARVVVRALLTTWRAKTFPENERYIMRNTEQGWAQLDWFLGQSLDQNSDALLNLWSAAP
jgi:Ser/Thr protein kinase RdoA (MazF antagonist)